MKRKKSKLVKNITQPSNAAIDCDIPHAQNDDDSWVFDKRTKIICVSIWAIYLIILLCLSLSPREIIHTTGSGLLGKILHFCFYTGLFMLTLICFFVMSVKKSITYTILFGMSIAIGTEILQLFIPGRSGTWADTCINLSGLFIIPILLLMAYESIDDENEEFIPNVF